MHQPRRRRPPRPTVMAPAVAALVALITAGCSSGHPSAPPPTGSDSAPSTSTHPADFSVFAGIWDGHGRGLQIAEDGSFKASARTYYDCKTTDHTPCDIYGDDGVIVSGRHATGRLVSAEGTTATGEVAESNDPTWLPKGPVTVTLNPAYDSVYFGDIVYCGPDTPPGVC